MRKIISYLLLLFIATFLVGCDETIIDDPTTDEPTIDEPTINELTIYSINDFHGALLEDGDKVGISKLGNYLINEKTTNPESTIILSAGDMFQGTAVSSMTRGKAVVEAMNIIGFDAMTLGNHEFDWGVNQIKAFFDKSEENGEASFPFLSANVNYKNNYELVEWANPYTIVNRGNLKIGIIGLLGTDQTNDILASHVKDYVFTDEFSAIKKYTKVLRSEEDCDIVIVSAHLDTADINYQLSSLTGDEKIDALINGHTHQQYYGELKYNREIPLPYVQSGSSGQYIGKITLEINSETKEVIDVASENMRATSVCHQESAEINHLMNNYQNYIDEAKSVLGVAGENIYKNITGIWMATAIQEKMGTDLGVVNSGGVRGSAFPIYANDNVSYGDIFEIMPFENTICSSTIPGKELLKILNYMNDGMYFSSNVTKSGQSYYINGVVVENGKLYRVGTIDYLFEKDYYPFMYGEEIVKTSILLREIMVDSVDEKIALYGKFYVTK